MISQTGCSTYFTGLLLSSEIVQVKYCQSCLASWSKPWQWLHNRVSQHITPPGHATMGEVALGASRERWDGSRFSGGAGTARSAGSLTGLPTPPHQPTPAQRSNSSFLLENSLVEEINNPTQSVAFLGNEILSRQRPVCSRLSEASVASNNGEKLHRFLSRVRALSEQTSHCYCWQYLNYPQH